jgi:hypothetical protein
MKKLIVTVSFILSIYTIYAQDFDLGGKIGVNYSQSIITNIISTGDVSVEDIENQPGIGIVFGGFARGTIGRFIFQPEILFSQSKSYVKINDISADDVLSGEISKVDVPLLAGVSVYKTFRLQAGPVFSNIKENSSESLLQFSDITVGYQLGFGFDIKKLTFDARYEGNFSKLENYIDTGSGTIQFDSRQKIFQFTLGYKLFD